MLRYLALAVLVGCSAAPGGASFYGSPGAEPAGVAGAADEALAGAPSDGGAADGPSVGGAPSSGGPVAKGGQTPAPPAGAPTVAGTGSSSGAPTGGAGGGGGGGGATSAGGGGSSSAGKASVAGAPSTCPADFYCHELGPDAFAKCVLEDQPDDPDFPGCTIQRGACFYPQDAPESCIKAECWSKKRTCG